MNDDTDVKTEEKKKPTSTPGPTPRHIVDMRADLDRIDELISSIERQSSARHKIEPGDFEELRERIGRLPLPKA